MKIIAHKTNLYNTQQFLKDSLQADYIDSIFIDVASTNDNQIIIFNYVDSNSKDLSQVANSNLQDLSATSLLTLEQFLTQYKNIAGNKPLIINLLVTNSFIGYEKIKAYMDQCLSILAQFPTLRISLCSVSNALLNYLKPKVYLGNLGWILKEGNFNYIDVGFYIFSPRMLNDSIIRQQLQFGKRVMIMLKDWGDLDTMTTHFQTSLDSHTLTRDMVEQIYIIGEYPSIIYHNITHLNK